MRPVKITVKTLDDFVKVEFLDETFGESDDFSDEDYVPSKEEEENSCEEEESDEDYVPSEEEESDEDYVPSEEEED